MIASNRSFPKICRILQKKDFEYLREKSRKGFSPPLILYSKSSRLNYPHLRLGLSVSTKQGGSVRRNRIKRILREEFRLYPRRSDLSYDLLVVAANKISDETQLRDSFKSLLDQLK